MDQDVVDARVLEGAQHGPQLVGVHPASLPPDPCDRLIAGAPWRRPHFRAPGDFLTPSPRTAVAILSP